MDELRPFQDPDLSLLQTGSACLAKHQDGLWHPARITGETDDKDLLGVGPFLKHPLCLSYSHSPPPLGWALGLHLGPRGADLLLSQAPSLPVSHFAPNWLPNL